MNTASFTRKLTIAASLCVAFASTGCIADSEEDLDEGPKAEEGDYESNEEFIESNQSLAASGSVTATSNALLNDVVNAAEWPWRIHTLHYDPTPILPRRMYFSSCKTGTDSPKMFVSMTVANPNTPVTEPKKTTGLLMKFSYNVTTKTYSRDASVSFPGCSEALGVATSNDCSVVGMLCRRPWGSPNPTKDLVAAIPDTYAWERNVMTQPGTPGKPNDELWLYEWTQPDVKTTPKKYVVHKGIGSWEYGSQHMIYAEQEKKWAVSLKMTTTEAGTTTKHEGDALVIVDRATMSIDVKRGWASLCGGTGHTLFNHPAYDPISSKFAVMCGTDYNLDGIAKIGAQVVHVEGQSPVEFWHYNMIVNQPKGGVGSFLPAPGGGFLGVVTGTATAPSAVQNFPLTPKTAIGFVRTDATGTATQAVKWFGTSGSTYLGHAQLAPLGNGRFLLGYAKFTNLAVDGNGQGGIKDDNTLRVPSSYWVLEVDANGNSLTQPKQIQNGWGEQDQMVPLGNGRVGWAYVPEFWRKGTASAGYTYPNPRSNNLQINVYTSTSN